MGISEGPRSGFSTWGGGGRMRQRDTTRAVRGQAPRKVF